MSNKIINVLIVEPGKHPQKQKITNDIKTSKIIISKGSYYISDPKAITLEKNICILFNEEASLLGLKGNRRINNDIIAGTFLIAGLDEYGNIISLSETMCQKYIKKFWNIEIYSDEEVSESYWSDFQKLLYE